jgi:hypothetical protein
MVTYTIINIDDHETHCHVDGKAGKNVYMNDQSMPNWFAKGLRVGDKVQEHLDKDGRTVAYCAHNMLYMMQSGNPYRDDVRNAKYILDEFRGIKNFSLDKLQFNIAIARALLRRKIVPTFSPVANLVVAKNIYATR